MSVARLDSDAVAAVLLLWIGAGAITALALSWRVETSAPASPTAVTASPVIARDVRVITLLVEAEEDCVADTLASLLTDDNVLAWRRPPPHVPLGARMKLSSREQDSGRIYRVRVWATRAGSRPIADRELTVSALATRADLAQLVAATIGEDERVRLEALAQVTVLKGLKGTPPDAAAQCE
jgi:hypothetical protein